jgi:hypothetical protein
MTKYFHLRIQVTAEDARRVRVAAAVDGKTVPQLLREVKRRMLREVKRRRRARRRIATAPSQN